ncbi:MAG: ABC transporter permease [Acidobacteria bacterium]|nr:ABC transporter permease [Acidobacteriota bacterium]
MSSSDELTPPLPNLVTPVTEVPKWRALLANQLTVLLVILVVLMVLLGNHNSRFFTSSEMSFLLADFSGLVLVAVAETFVIISGGIDLSVGSVMAVSGVLAARAMQPLINSHTNEAVVLLLGTAVALGVGMLAGAINATLIVGFNVVPFVATLAMWYGGQGLALVWTGGQPYGLNPGAQTWSAATIPGVPFMSWLSLIVIGITIVLGLVLRKARYGRYTFAIGSNNFAARAAGISVQRYVGSFYVLSGALAGLTGMFFDIRLGSGAPTTGQTTTLIAIAAVVIGGTSLFGGSGTYLGTVLGAAILIVVQDGAIFVNVSANWVPVVVASVVAVASIIQSGRLRLRRRS